MLTGSKLKLHISVKCKFLFLCPQLVVKTKYIDTLIELYFTFTYILIRQTSDIKESDRLPWGQHGKYDKHGKSQEE